MISVFDALNSVESAGRGLRDDEAGLDRIVQAAAAETARLRGEQADLFRSLARLKLDALRQNQVIGPLDEAERRALAALKEQETRLNAVSARREALAGERTAAGRDREERARKLTEAADALNELRAATERRMADDVAWQAQAAKVSGVEAQAKAADAKATQAEADRDEKAKPYLADTLFVYLWERGYGTPAYRAGPLARLGDGFVAKVVDYEPARQNYFTLTEIPKRLREHAERLKADFAAEEAKLTEIERAALEADGIAAKEAAWQAADAAVKEAEKTIADIEAELAGLDGALSDGGPWGMGGVLGDLAQSLQREDLRSLLREALETPTPDDERIVRRLQDVEDELAKQAKAAEEARQALVALARRKAEVERSRDEFRRYERGGGGFSNDKLIGDVLGGIIGGVLSSRELRDALRSGYRPGGSRGSAPSRPGGGVFGGSRGSSSGSSSGGGFSTGGGF